MAQQLAKLQHLALRIRLRPGADWMYALQGDSAGAVAVAALEDPVVVSMYTLE